MRPASRAPAAAALALALAAAATAARAGNDPSGVVLVLDADDPVSVEVGEHYARVRHLSERQVVRLRVRGRRAEEAARTAAPPPDLSLAEFRSLVEEPLRDHLFREGLDERARYVVLAKGIPVRVRLEGAFASTAALVATMDLPFCGAAGAGLPGAPQDALAPADRANPYRDGPFPEDRRPAGRPLRLVTALDAFDAADARALVDRSLAADTGPPADPLFVFQDAAGPASGRNASYTEGIEALRALGRRVETAKAGPGEVVGRKDLMGWMSGGSYSRLSDEGVRTNAFAPGALVDMLESFGAVPVNFDPAGAHQQFPVTRMVAAGATGVHGAVAEPYAHTFPDTRLFARYVSGFDLAESFHASLPYLHWMNLVLGDPLCAPFARRPAVSVTGAPSRVTAPRPFTLRVAGRAVAGGPAPVGLRLFVDGRPAGEAAGASASFEVDPSEWPEGTTVLLAVADTDAPTAVRGFHGMRLEVRHARARVVRLEPPADAPAVAPGAPLSAHWDGTARGGSPVIVLREAGGADVRGEAERDLRARTATFRPAAPLLPGREYEAELRGVLAEPLAWRFTAGPAALEATGPAGATAGTPFALAVRAAGQAAEGASLLAGERVEVRDEAGMLLASADVPALHSGDVAVRIALTRSGDARLTVRGRRSGATASVVVPVSPGPAARLLVRATGKIRAGADFDVEVRAADAHGNAIAGWTGSVTLVAPGTEGAVLPAPAEARDGRATFRGVRLPKAGAAVLGAVAGALEGGVQVRVAPAEGE